MPKVYFGDNKTSIEASHLLADYIQVNHNIKVDTINNILATPLEGISNYNEAVTTAKSLFVIDNLTVVSNDNDVAINFRHKVYQTES